MHIYYSTFCVLALTWKTEYLISPADVTWQVVPLFLEGEFGMEWGLFCCHLIRLPNGHGEVYFWLSVPLDEEEVENLRTKTIIQNQWGVEHKQTSPVFPMSWDRQKIIKHIQGHTTPLQEYTVFLMINQCSEGTVDWDGNEYTLRNNSRMFDKSFLQINTIDNYTSERNFEVKLEIYEKNTFDCNDDDESEKHHPSVGITNTDSDA